MDENLQLPPKHNLPKQQEDEEQSKRRKLAQFFSDLTDDELVAIFGEGVRFELARVRLSYEHIFADHKLFGTIQAAAGDGGFSSDPLLQLNPPSFDIFNREFNNPMRVSQFGYQNLLDLSYCSPPLSSNSVVHVSAKLYVTTDKLDDIVDYPDDDPEPPNLQPDAMVQDSDDDLYGQFDNIIVRFDDTVKEEQDEDVEYINEAFHVCDDRALIKLSDKPNGSGCNTLKGKHGYLEMFYVALRYAVDAVLEVEFTTDSANSKVVGTAKAYYGKGFGYDPPAEYYHVRLLDPEYPAYVTRGQVNLLRSELSVPANYSLIIEAKLQDQASEAKNNPILSGTREFRVPRDFRSLSETIVGVDCSLKLTVKWKLPSEKLKISSSSNCQSSGS